MGCRNIVTARRRTGPVSDPGQLVRVTAQRAAVARKTVAGMLVGFADRLGQAITGGLYPHPATARPSAAATTRPITAGATHPHCTSDWS